MTGLHLCCLTWLENIYHLPVSVKTCLADKLARRNRVNKPNNCLGLRAGLAHPYTGWLWNEWMNETLGAETGAKEYFENCWENVLTSCQTDATNIAENLNVKTNLPEKRQRGQARQFLNKGTEETQSTPNETSEGTFLWPWLTQPSEKPGWQVSRRRSVYDLYDFLFSRDNMKQTTKNGKLHERCKKLEPTLHDINADDLTLEINSSLYIYPGNAVVCPCDTYNDKLLDLFSNLSITLRELWLSLCQRLQMRRAVQLWSWWKHSTWGLPWAETGSQQGYC